MTYDGYSDEMTGIFKHFHSKRRLIKFCFISKHRLAQAFKILKFHQFSNCLLDGSRKAVSYLFRILTVWQTSKTYTVKFF